MYKFINDWLVFLHNLFCEMFRAIDKYFFFDAKYTADIRTDIFKAVLFVVKNQKYFIYIIRQNIKQMLPVTYFIYTFPLAPEGNQKICRKEYRKNYGRKYRFRGSSGSIPFQSLYFSVRKAYYFHQSIIH